MLWMSAEVSEGLQMNLGRHLLSAASALHDDHKNVAWLTENAERLAMKKLTKSYKASEFLHILNTYV